MRVVQPSESPARGRRRPLLPRALRGRLFRLREQLRSVSTISRRLLAYAHGRRSRLATAFGLTVGLMTVRLLEPWPLKLIFDHVLLDAPLPGRLGALATELGTAQVLALLIASIVALAGTSGLLYYHQSLLTSRLGQEVVAQLRFDLYRHLQALSFSFHDRRKTGDLIVRLVTDIRLVRDAVVGLPIGLAESALMILGMSVIMLWMDWQLALFAFVLLPLLALVVRHHRRPMRSAVRKQRQQEGDLATFASDSLGGIRAIQGFGLEERIARRFGGANRRSLKQGLKAARIEAKMRWTSDVSVGLMTAGVVAFASWRILRGELSPGDLIVFIAYLRAYSRPLRRISKTTERVARTAAAAERILDLFAHTPEIADRPGAVSVDRLPGAIELERVGFRHGRRAWVLRNVSLRIAPGERVGIVGPTGAGKSSLISLVPRFYEATEGVVRIDGHDVRDLTLESLRRQISLVFQEPILFADTISENISYGRPEASREEVVEAARRAGIHDIIEELPDGYDTLLGERGGTLSGGQRQCVSIARAMLRDAPIVILDEPTTGLDARSSALVSAAIQRLVAGRTVLLISHDLRTLRNVDRIVVLEGGRVVQQGRYEELAACAGLFRDLEAHGGVG
ncbi:MAG TPA: ABC transporter ATP-binding protein [Thermoanaerobaculia bacterium]|nr:ABC transporter ATP-binding protein [Thermoanaerobaculia bacterium]